MPRHSQPCASWCSFRLEHERTSGSTGEPVALSSAGLRRMGQLRAAVVDQRVPPMTCDGSRPRLGSCGFLFGGRHQQISRAFDCNAALMLVIVAPLEVALLVRVATGVQVVADQ